MMSYIELLSNRRIQKHSNRENQHLHLRVAEKGHIVIAFYIFLTKKS